MSSDTAATHPAAAHAGEVSGKKAAPSPAAAALLGTVLAQQQAEKRRKDGGSPQSQLVGKEPLASSAEAPRSEAVWTAGQLRSVPAYQLAWASVERGDWRGPKYWRSRLKQSQLEALRKMSGQ